MESLIRQAGVGDAAAMLAIYAPFVLDTAVSFEEEVPSVPDFAARVGAVLAEAPWLVAEREGRVLGYAYAGRHRARAAYRLTREVSVYVHPDYHRQGLATRLYNHLLERLGRAGFTTALAGITLPNPASLAFHRKFGFQVVGTYHRVGYKFGRYHNVLWLERPLRTT